MNGRSEEPNMPVRSDFGELSRAGVLAIRGLDVLFKYAFDPESLCAPARLSSPKSEMAGIFGSAVGRS